MAAAVVAGPPTDFATAPIVRIEDDRARELILLGVDREDLVLSFARKAAAWCLDRPDVRFATALSGVDAGYTISVAAFRGWGVGLILS